MASSYNDGPGDPATLGGSSYGWDKRLDAAYSGGIVAGICQHWPDLGTYLSFPPILVSVPQT
jgi:hypothetical protein